MMVIDRKQIDAALTMQPTADQCRAIDKVLSERRRVARMRAAAAIRAGDDSPWLVLRVMTGREIAVRDDLEAANIEALVPMKMGKERRRRNEKIPAREEPVLVGYILARCRIDCDSMAGLLTFEHVVSILGGYQSPLLVKAENVHCFNEKANKGEFDYERPVTVFIGIKKVRITDGPFVGLCGDVVTSVGGGKGNAVIEVNLFNQSVPMIMPLAILAPL